MKKIIIVLLIAVLGFSIPAIFYCDKIDVEAANFSNDIESGAVYTIKNNLSGFYMDVAGAGTGNRTLIKQSTKSTNLNQRFYLRNMGNNEWEIVPIHIANKSMVLDVEYGYVADNTRLILWERNNGAAQRFRFVKNADNTYKIKTKETGFTKCLAMLNNEMYSGAQIVQNSASSYSSNWVITREWGKTYTNPETLNLNSYITPPTHDIFGVPQLGKGGIKEEVVPAKRLKTSHWIGGNTYEDYTKGFVRYYKYPVHVSMRIKLFETPIGLSDGMSASYTTTRQYAYSETYEKTITTAIRETSGVGASAGFEIKNLPIKISADKEFEKTISQQFSYAQQFSETITIGREIKVTPAKNATYYFELRGVFYLYYVQVFEYDYERTSSQNWTKTYYNYTFKNTMRLKETLINWQLVDNAQVGVNPYRFNGNLGKYEYVGEREQGVIYV